VANLSGWWTAKDFISGSREGQLPPGAAGKGGANSLAKISFRLTKAEVVMTKFAE